MLLGYKTLIGLVVMGIGSVISLVGYPEVGDTLTNAGGIIAGIGAVGKIHRKEV